MAWSKDYDLGGVGGSWSGDQLQLRPENCPLVIVGGLINNLFSKLIKWHEAKIMTLAG